MQSQIATSCPIRCYPWWFTLYPRITNVNTAWPIMGKYDVIHTAGSTKRIAVPPKDDRTAVTGSWKFGGIWTCGFEICSLTDTHAESLIAILRTYPRGEVIVDIHAGFVSCKKKNRNAKNMASAGARAYMGVWGLKAFYCQRQQICHSHLSKTWSKIVNKKRV